MRKFVVIILALILVACSRDSGKEEIRGRIAKYRKQENELQQKINRLNEQLEGMEGVSTGSYRIPVFVKEMKPDTFSHFINANGTVEAVQDAFISPETNGQITRIYVDEGTRVKKGELLVSLNTSVIRSNIQEVKTNLELARKTYRKQKRLWQDSIGSEMQFLEAENRKESLENRLETLREQLDMSEIRAPFDGIVEKINQKEGELGTPGIQLLHLVNLKNLRIESEIAENYMARINEGDRVKIRFPAFPDGVKTVPIIRKGSVIDRESRTFVIEARIENYDERIKPNQIAIVKVRDYTNDSALFVPSNVIKQDMQGDYVYVLKEGQDQNRSRKVYVETGRTFSNQTEITKGLEVGQKVITTGYTQVSEGSEVTVKKKEELMD